MNIIDHIQSNYGVSPEYLWQKYPQYCIFRHQHNHKWFAALMKDIPAYKIGLKNNQAVDLLNLKCNPELAQMVLIDNKSIFPAYHMNKKHWISVAIEQCDDDELSNLIASSYRLTN